MSKQYTQCVLLAFFIGWLAGLSGLGAQEASLPIMSEELPAPREAAFAQKPEVKKTAEGWAISFAAKSEIDATVEIRDAQDKVVRHLASGVLNARAPEPFKAGSLTQTVLWDGTDDVGKKVSGDFKVRVALGLKPTYGDTLGFNEQLVPRPVSMAVGPEGTLYVMTCFGDGHHTPGMPTIIAYDREGKYIRQVMPFPHTMTREQLAGVKPMPVGKDGYEPIMYHALVHVMYPYVTGMGRCGIAVSADGKRLLLPGKSGHSSLLLRIGTDGSAPADFKGPKICKGGVEGCPHLAASPDGKYVYAGGLLGHKIYDHKNLQHCIYRMNIDGDAPAEIFVGQVKTAGKGELLNGPRGVACDAKGNVYVCDTGNNRIAIFGADGKLQREIAVPSPDVVQVHPQSGEVYVLSAPLGKGQLAPVSNAWYWWPKKTIYKFDAEGKEVAKLTYPSGKGKRSNGGNSVMALDGGATPPVLYIGPAAYGDSSTDRIVDMGSALKLEERWLKRPAGTPQIQPKYLTVDRTTETVHAQGLAFNGKTGEYLGSLRAPLAKVERAGFGEEVVAPDGSYAVHRSGMGAVICLDPNERKKSIYKLYNTPELKQTGDTGKLYGGFMFPRGMGIGPDNNLYCVHHQGKFRNRHRTAVSVVGPDGEIKAYQIIKVEGPSACARADSKGNIYLGSTLRPMWDSKVRKRNEWSNEGAPRRWRDHLPTEGSYRMPVSGMYEMVYGSLVKFSPKGGQIRMDAKGSLLIGSGDGDIVDINRGEIEGAEWLYPGLSPMPFKPTNGYMGGCVCEQARFDVGPHDRLFVPEALRYSVAVLDSNGNLITRFGRYGNMDARGPKGPLPTDDIHFGWPMAVAASHDHAYVGDYVNWRVVKVNLAYQVEESVPLAGR